MNERKIAVIGDPSSVMIFKAIGLDVFYEEKEAQIEQRIHKLADQGYAAIYITEKAAELAKDAIDIYATATFPAIIPIPSSTGVLGIGMNKLKSNVEKAVGADILFREG